MLPAPVGAIDLIREQSTWVEQEAVRIGDRAAVLRQPPFDGHRRPELVLFQTVTCLAATCRSGEESGDGVARRDDIHFVRFGIAASGEIGVARVGRRQRPGAASSSSSGNMCLRPRRIRAAVDAVADRDVADGAPAPDVTVKWTVTAWPAFEASGLSAVMAAVVVALFNVTAFDRR